MFQATVFFPPIHRYNKLYIFITMKCKGQYCFSFNAIILILPHNAKRFALKNTWNTLFKNVEPLRVVRLFPHNSC